VNTTCLFTLVSHTQSLAHKAPFTFRKKASYVPKHLAGAPSQFLQPCQQKTISLKAGTCIFIHNWQS